MHQNVGSYQISVVCFIHDFAIFTLKEIVNQRKSSDPLATERLYLFYSVKIPPLWKLEVSPLNLGIQIYVY